MAKIYITEFDSMVIDTRGQSVMAPKYPAVARQSVLTSTGSTQQSAAFGGTTRYIELHTDGIISIDIGANPTADTNYGRVGSGERMFVGVQPGHKLAYISNT